MTKTELLKTHGVPRSPHWPKVRKQFLLRKACAVCNGVKKLEAHHIKPFHMDQTLELDPLNLIALCEVDRFFNCHRIIGHLNNFRGWNPDVIANAKEWRQKLIDNRARESQSA